MKDYESGFLALILAGILMMVIGIGLMIPAARAPDNPSVSSKGGRSGPRRSFAAALDRRPRVR